MGAEGEFALYMETAALIICRASRTDPLSLRHLSLSVAVTIPLLVSLPHEQAE